MNCPKCKGVMAKVSFEGVEIDRCVACDGLWLDVLEKEHLAEMAGSEAIDPGVKPGDASDPRHLLCPVCRTLMIPMTVHGHAGLRYESCTVCYGAFFDAGEFREYKGAVAQGETGVLAILRGLVGANARGERD
jgi:Zn-finger nucleic acid-binding protein